MKMKGAILYGPKDVRLEEVEVPEIGPEEILVEIKAALTCGTDAKVYLQGGHPRMIKPPALFGHEFSGLIAQVGSKVKNFKKGMRVVAANSAPCNHCFYCKIGRQSLCENLLFINGAYAQYIKIPEVVVKQNLLKIPESTSFKEAALVEPLACVLHGVDSLGVKLGDTVAVNGAGPIGLLFIQLLKLRGARVIVSDKKKERLDVAKNLGADEMIDISKGEAQEVRKLTEQGRGVDIAIEAVGNPSVWENTIKMVRKGGTALLFGGCPPGTTINLDTELLHYSEITIKGVFHHTPYYVEKALELITRRDIDVNALITGELPLERLSKALEMIINHKGIKTAVIP
jgi:L-iditol 2-dehydrogenase